MRYVIETRHSKSRRGGTRHKSEPHDRDWTYVVTVARLAERLKVRLRFISFEYDELAATHLEKVAAKTMEVRARMSGTGVRLTLPPLDKLELHSVGIELESGRFLFAEFERVVNLFAGTHNDITLHAPTQDLTGVSPSIARTKDA